MVEITPQQFRRMCMAVGFAFLLSALCLVVVASFVAQGVVSMNMRTVTRVYLLAFVAPLAAGIVIHWCSMRRQMKYADQGAAA
ncbi:hypothetical protein AB4Y45_33465 [Paraburkholderia sp. EG287A]|uniref:hypothetical protein n=1 Tax=Paraburkholderia sp. EG287A TaxID=3237012 RepID=UPI0034D383C3